MTMREERQYAVDSDALNFEMYNVSGKELIFDTVLFENIMLHFCKIEIEVHF